MSEERRTLLTQLRPLQTSLGAMSCHRVADQVRLGVADFGRGLHEARLVYFDFLVSRQMLALRAG